MNESTHELIAKINRRLTYIEQMLDMLLRAHALRPPDRPIRKKKKPVQPYAPPVEPEEEQPGVPAAPSS
jgi:hypothetical protein